MPRAATLLHLDDDEARGARVAELVQYARPDLLYRRRPLGDSALASPTARDVLLVPAAAVRGHCGDGRRIIVLCEGPTTLLAPPEARMVRTTAELLDALAAWAPPSDQRLQVVLVVNDCQVMLRVESRLFEEYLGVRTIGAETNASALAAALRDRPDVIVSDLVRPGGSGKDFVEALLGHEELCEAPVVIFSASARYQKLADWAGAVGVVALRELPAPPEDLVDIVAYALGRDTSARWDGPTFRSPAREIVLDRRQLTVNVDWRRRRLEALASRLRR